MKLPKPNEKISRKEINPKFLLLYGSPKVGKTSIIESLEDSYLLIEIDPHGAAYFEGTYIEVDSLEELNEVIEEIRRQKRPYNYVIIDTITKLAEWMEEYATMMYKQSNLGKNFVGENVVGELKGGAGYHWLRRAFAIWFNELKTLADRVIFLGHVKDSALTMTTRNLMGQEIKVERLGIDEVTTMDINLTGQLKYMACSQMDAIGFLYRKTVMIERKQASELRVNFEAGDSVLGGSRPIHLRGRDMKFDWKQIYLEENNA